MELDLLNDNNEDINKYNSYYPIKNNNNNKNISNDNVKNTNNNTSNNNTKTNKDYNK